MYWQPRVPTKSWGARLLLVDGPAGVDDVQAPPAGGTLSQNEFMKFVKNVKLPSKALTLAEIDLIFIRANREDEEDAKEEAMGIDDNPDRELLPSEFIEALYARGPRGFVYLYECMLV